MKTVVVLTSFIVPLFPLPVVRAQIPRYYPDGSLAEDHRPYLLDQEHSTCYAVNNLAGLDY